MSGDRATAFTTLWVAFDPPKAALGLAHVSVSRAQLCLALWPSCATAYYVIFCSYSYSN